MVKYQGYFEQFDSLKPELQNHCWLIFIVGFRLE